LAEVLFSFQLAPNFELSMVADDISDDDFAAADSEEENESA
jgi:hypothetical protein